MRESVRERERERERERDVFLLFCASCKSGHIYDVNSLEKFQNLHGYNTIQIEQKI